MCRLLQQLREARSIRDSHLNREEKEDIIVLRTGLIRTITALEKSRCHDETSGLASFFWALLS